MDWKQQWIDEVLGIIPQGYYRRRAEVELRNHLEDRHRTLTEPGMTESEARAEALRTMGELDKLQKEYMAAWRQSPERKLTVRSAVVIGCILILFAYLLTTAFMHIAGLENGGFFIDHPILNGHGSIYRINCDVYHTVQFLVPSTLGALFLRFFLPEERRTVGLITADLLIAWIGGKAVIILFTAPSYNMPLGLELLKFVYHGRFIDTPWFLFLLTIHYVLTILGCILLGQIIGRLPIKANKHRLA